MTLPAGLWANLTLLAWFDCRKGWQPNVIGVRYLLQAQGSSDSHPSPSDTLTRLTLHLNKVWPSQQAAGIGAELTLATWFVGRKGRQPKVIGVRDLLEAKGSLDSNPSPSDILTRLTLHLNKVWPSLLVLVANLTLLACFDWRKGCQSHSYWCERLVWGPWQLRHPSTTLWHPLTPLQDSHYTWIRSDPPCRSWGKPHPACLVWWKEGQTTQGYWCERLVGGPRQPRHPSITLCHPYKTHTTPE